MPPRLSLALVAVALTLAGCTQVEPRAKSSTVVLAAKAIEPLPTMLAPAVDAIVLIEAGGSTLLYADGTVRETTPDLRVIANGRVMTLAQPHVQKKYRCESTGIGGTPTVDDYDSLSLSLTDADDKEIVLVPPLDYAPNAYTFDKLKTTVTAVLGPNVFVEVWRDTWNCGAIHPNFGNEGHRFDAKSGKELAIEPPPEAFALAAERLKREGLDGGDVHVEQAVVHFDATGHAALDWIFWKEATFVDGIPRTTIAMPDLPPALAKRSEPPASVAIFLKAHPQHIRGWSHAD